MAFINSINYTNNNKSLKSNGVHFGAQKKELSKDGSYYTYYKDKDKDNYMKDVNKLVYGSWAGIIGLTLLGLFAYDKLLSKKLYESIKNKKLAFLATMGICSTIGAASTIVTGLIKRSILTNKTKLHPISKEEQEKKEIEIKKFITDVAKEKDVTVKSIKFYDYRSMDLLKSAIASFDGLTGDLTLNSKFKDTDLSIEEAKPFIVHELEHAKQFEKIFRTKDGIYDLNLGWVKKADKMTGLLFKRDLLKAKYEDIPALMKADMNKHPENYYLIEPEKELQENIRMYKAVKMYNGNQNISKYDLPLIVDEDYYNQVVKNKPPATLEEAASAKIYLDYLLSDKGAKANVQTNFLAYANDPMEQEAYQAQFDYIKTGKI